MSDKIHEIFMKYYEFEVLIDHMTGKKYMISQDKKRIYLDEEWKYDI
jgi:hypothetical protein